MRCGRRGLAYGEGPMTRPTGSPCWASVARGRHGWFEHETRDGQTFVVDVVLHVDTRPAAAATTSPTPSTTAWSATPSSRLIEGEPVRLVETLAQRIADACLADSRVEAGRGGRAQAGGAA